MYFSWALFLPFIALLHAFPTRVVQHLEPVFNFAIFHNEKRLQTYGEADRDVGNRPYPEHIKIQFSAFQKNYEYAVSLQTVFTPESILTIQNGDDVRIEPLRSTSYSVHLEDGGWVTATIAYDGLLHATVLDGEEFFEVNPLRLHKRDMEASHFSLLSEQATEGMVAFKLSDLDTSKWLCGASETGTNETQFTSRVAARHLLQVQQWTNCFPNSAVTRRLYFGVAADFGYFTAVGGTTKAATDYIAQSVATSNTVYKTQVNVVLTVRNIIVQTSSTGGPAWNYNRVGTSTCPDINTALNTFTTWRSASQAQAGISQGTWHLLTDCFPPPGTVGLSWIGVLCDMNWGAGLTSYSTGMWLTLAHELGHNFGALHDFENGIGTTGGIMDYGNGTYLGYYQFNSFYNEAQVCGNITKFLSCTSSNCVPLTDCWASYAPVCGNGVIEGTEQCDDGVNNGVSPSCCSNQCLLTAGSECSIGSGECCVNCLMASASQSCRGGSGYCSAGQCLTPVCASFSGITFSPCTVPAGSCLAQCYVSGSCNSMAGWYDTSTGQPFDMKVADGTICSRSPYSTCVSGTCTANTVSPVTYSWATSPSWSSCSVTCGSGTQTRTVWCAKNDGTVAANSNCAGTQPSSSQSCTLSACLTYLWANAQTWSTCTTNCGGGTQTRPAQICYLSTQPGVAVASSLCTQPAPPTTQSCNTVPCSVRWITGGWSSCSASCGSGHQTRSVTCIKVQNNVVVAISASSCSSLPQPSSSQSCNTSPCAALDWSFGAWSACNVTCGSGLQVAAVGCRNTTSNDQILVSSGLCVAANQPAATRSCGIYCPAYIWQASPWGNCSSECGGGTQYREVSCVTDDSYRNVSSSYLCVASMPLTAQVCNSALCPNYNWVLGSWSTCSASCNTGTTTRSVVCQDISQTPPITYGDSFCSQIKPDTTQDCNAQSCPTYVWQSTDWSDCSVNCGGGYQSRNATCIQEGTTTVAPDGFCLPPKPTISQPCGTDSCSNYGWSVTPWSLCSKQCGTGQRFRTVTCTSAPLCNADQPNATESCNTFSCPVIWSTSSWSNCDKLCGSGQMNRSVQCVDSGSNAPVSGNSCSGVKPSSNTVCNPNPCPSWSPGPWSSCSAQCGDGVSTRQINCLDYSGLSLDVSSCASLPIPSSQQPCNVAPCPHWSPGSWSPCNSTCGGGVQSRELVCRMPEDTLYNGVVTNSTLCPSTLPPTEQSCASDPCPIYYYQLTGWGLCNASCGGGVQMALLNCTDAASNITVSNSLCIGDGPSTSRICNSQPCSVYKWTTTGWGACSAACGGGFQDQLVSCLDVIQNAVVEDSFCPSYSQPSTNQSCNTGLGCGLQGTCKNYTNGNGFCKCKPGYSGDFCDVTPLIYNVTLDIAQFPEGVPLGENVLLSWTSKGAIPFVSILLDKGSWRYPQYKATKVTNDVTNALQANTYTLTLGSTLPYGNDYQIYVYYSPQSSGVSSQFAIADPCFYVNCGPHGTCISGQGVCTCLQGYSGGLCQLSPCAYAQCNLGTSTCSNTGPGAGFCKCASGWTGVHCNVPLICAGFTCQNFGSVVGASTSNSVAACQALTCSCLNFFTGNQCQTCSLVCKNGGKADDSCLYCQCGQNSGFLGRDCSCQYYVVSLVISEPVDSSWLNSSSDVSTFKQTFAQDVANALSNATFTVNPKQISVTYIQNAGTTPGGTPLLQIMFLLTDVCNDVFLDESSLFNAFPQEALSSSTSLPALPHSRRLLGTAEGSNVYLNQLVQLLRNQFSDIDTPLYQGYITSSIEPTQGMMVWTHPSDLTPVAPPPKKSWIDENYWVLVVAIGGGVLLLAFLCGVFWFVRSKRSRIITWNDERLSMPTSAQEIGSGTDAQAVYQQELDRTAESTDSLTELTSPRLPDGWTRMYEARTGTYYYYNTKSGTAQWEVPTREAS